MSEKFVELLLGNNDIAVMLGCGKARITTLYFDDPF